MPTLTTLKLVLTIIHNSALTLRGCYRLFSSQVVDAGELRHLRREHLVRKNKRVLVKETKRDRRGAERWSAHSEHG